jgi:thioesterase domain-containing protein
MILFLTAVSEESDLAPDRSWSHLAESGVEIHQIPGEHLTIFDARYVPVIVDKLETCFRGAQVTPSRFSRSDLGL